MAAKRPSFSVVAHYPVSSEEEQRLRDEGNTEYPSDCYEVGSYYRFRDAKAACLRKNRQLSGGAYAAIVDNRIASQLTPNHYGRYEGYE